MDDRTFPLGHRRRTIVSPAPVVRVLRREPLAAIREVLSVSIHDVVNEPRVKRRVAELWRVTGWIENDRWLRRCLEEL